MIFSISRLEAYASKNLLTDGVNVEKILLRKEPLTQIIGETNHTYSAMSSLVEDRVSRQILNEQSMIIKERNPVQVSTNGNCLFNSLSVDMCGNESLATRLRVLTCIEMVSNKLIYDTSKHNRLELVSPSYDEACKAAAKIEHFRPHGPFLPQRRY
ncbi:unnamed protein product [Mytilus edulis]|uniref:OTU domain-containing protein n=1 Tax=Mytilus edulis TaxID=6550 RepID=A0A8S3VFG9_MYTED|nr:unnamed protein product [Mytilus edulis]